MVGARDARRRDGHAEPTSVSERHAARRRRPGAALHLRRDHPRRARQPAHPAHPAAPRARHGARAHPARHRQRALARATRSSSPSRWRSSRHAQTLTMLTGGIDLSVGFVATAVAFVMASLVAQMDAVVAIPLSLLPAAPGRARDRDRRGRLPRPPADHDPGRRSRRAGLPARLPACPAGLRPDRPRGRRLAGHGPLVRPPQLPARLRAAGRVHHLSGCAARASADCSTRSATTRAPHDSPACAAGRSWWRSTSSQRLLAGIGGLVYVGLINMAVARPCRRAAAALGGRSGHRRHVHLRRPRRLCRHDRRAPSSSASWRTILTVTPGAGGRAPRHLRRSSSSSSRQPTSASAESVSRASAMTEPPRATSAWTWAAPTSSGPSSSARATTGRPSTRARSPTDVSGGEGTVVRAAGGAGSSRSATASAAASTRVGVAVPGLYIPETGVVTFLTNVPGDWSATPVGRAARRGDRACPPPSSTTLAPSVWRSCVSGPAGACASFIGLTLGTGIGGVIRHRRPGRAGLPRPGRRARPPDDRPGRAVVRLRQPRLRGGLCAGRPGRHVCGTADPREAIERARAGDERASRWPRRDRSLPRHRHRQRRDAADARARHPGRGLVERRRRSSSSPSRRRCGAASSRRRWIGSTSSLAELGVWAGAIGAAVHGAERPRSGDSGASDAAGARASVAVTIGLSDRTVSGRLVLGDEVVAGHLDLEAGSDRRGGAGPRRRTTSSSRPASSTSTSTAGAATTRWTARTRSTAWRGPWQVTA